MPCVPQSQRKSSTDRQEKYPANTYRGRILETRAFSQSRGVAVLAVFKAAEWALHVEDQKKPQTRTGLVPAIRYRITRPGGDPEGALSLLGTLGPQLGEGTPCLDNLRPTGLFLSPGLERSFLLHNALTAIRSQVRGQSQKQL